MRVPLSNQQIETTRARQTVRADAGAFGGNAVRGAQIAGQGVVRLSGAIAAREKRIAEENDAAAAMDAYALASDNLRELTRGDGGYLTLSGRDAADGYDEAAREVQRIPDAHREALSDNAKQAFDRLWAGRLDSALNSMSNHAARERKRFFAASAQAVTQQSTLDAIEAWSNPQSVETHLKRGEVAIRAANAGQPADATELAVSAFRSDATLSAISAAIDSQDFEAAEDLREAFEEQLIGDQRSTADELLREGDLVRRRQVATDEIFAEFGTDARAARAHIRENYEGQLEDAILRDYNLRADEQRISQAKQKEAVLQQAVTAIEGGTRVDDLPLTQFLALSEGERKWLQRREQGLPSVTDWDAYIAYDELSPEQLRHVDLNEARTQLADTEFNALSGRVRDAREGNTVTAPGLGLASRVNLAAEAAGIKRPEDRLSLSNSINEGLQDFTEREGRKPTRVEEDEIVERLTTEVVISRPGDWWGRARQRDRVFEVEEFADSTIPAEHAQGVLAAFPDQDEIDLEDMEAFYSAAVGAYAERGVPNPTADEIRDGITFLREQARAQ
ncbi:MAG: hypothetical protein AAF583_01650 [Pseudomonadota bacterium]